MAPILKRSELPQDAVRELRRCGQGNALFDRELTAYKRLFEEDETMDETYKVLLVSLLSHANPNVEREEADEDKIPNEKCVLKKRVSNESRTPASGIDIIEISSTEEEAEAPKCCNRKILVKKSRINSKEDHKKVINKKSTTDADTDYYGYYDDDESEDSDMDMMKPRRSLKGRRFAHKSRDVGESSRVAQTDSKLEYRRQVLEIMSKPYDLTDYTSLNNKLDDGLYAKLFPELGKELDKCRHNRRKQLALMRGFDFWIRDLAREGAFQPWRDEECLAVESAPPVTSPPPPPPSSSHPAKANLKKQDNKSLV